MQQSAGHQGLNLDSKTKTPPRTVESTTRLSIHETKIGLVDESTTASSPNWRHLFYFTTRRQLFVLIPAICLSIVTGVLELTEAYLLSKIFDSLSKYASGMLEKDELKNKMTIYCVYSVGLGCLHWVLQGTLYALWAFFGEMQARGARRALFHAFIKKSMAWFDTQEDGVRSFSPRLQTNVLDLRNATSQSIGTAFKSLTACLASIGLSMYSSWKITLVTICGIPIIGCLFAWIASRQQPVLKIYDQKLSEAGSHAIHAFSSIDAIKIFNGQQSAIWRYIKAVKGAGELYNRQGHWVALQFSLVQFSSFVLFVQGLWYGSTLLFAGKVNAGQIFMTVWASLQMIDALNDFLPQLNILDKGQAAASKLRNLLDCSDEFLERSGPLKPHLRHEPRSIHMQQVSFSYPSRPDQTVLASASMSFPAGEMRFIIGSSGSGKTTIGQLLTRLYPCTHGLIDLDGYPLEKLDLVWLRSRITLVEQHSVLFNDSIWRNIAYGSHGSPPVTRTDVQKAAEFAVLGQALSDMPRGLETTVGENGNALSGGQKQRVALARARIRDSPILILDESTSAMDYVTRIAMMKAVRAWRKNKTTIVITHDTSQIAPQDFVYVVENGCIIKQGYQSALELHNHHSTSPLSPKFSPLADPEDSDNIIEPSLHGNDGHFSDVIAEKRRRRISLFSSVHNLKSAVSLEVLHSEPETLNHRLSIQSVKMLENLEDANSVAQMMLSPRHSTYTNHGQLRVLRANSIITQPSIFSLQVSEEVQQILAAADEKRTGWTEHDVSSARLSMEHSALSLLQIMQTIWPRLGLSARLMLLVGLLALIVQAITRSAFGWLLGQLLGTFNLTENRARKTAMYSGLIIGLAVVGGISLYATYALLDGCAEIWVNRLRAECMKRVVNQPRSFFDGKENSVTQLMACFDNHAENTKNIIAKIVIPILILVLMMISSLVWSLSIGWALTLVGISFTPLIYGTTNVLNRLTSYFERLTNDAVEATAGVFAETFGNIKTVKLLTLEEIFEVKHEQAVQSSFRTTSKKAFYFGFLFGLSSGLIFFGIALLVWYSGELLVSGRYSVNQIVQVFTMLLTAFANASGILASIPRIGSSRESANRLLRLAQLPETSYEHEGTTRPRKLGDISLNSLSFRYPSRPDQLILNNVSLYFVSGSFTAIVGSTGSGKSTIASLLLKLYPTRPTAMGQKAEIEVAGRDIRRIHTPTLRTLISVVPQTPYFFPISVAENILYGIHDSSPLRSMENIRAAAKATGIDDFIMSLPLGYETLLGDNGVGVSGGQAQRIAVARALVRKPQVLILDEATSALDAESRRVIAEAITNLIDRRKDGVRTTVIAITHERDMMRIADRIIMLEKGEVVEEGSFDELNRKKQRFTRLLKGGNESDEEG
ncbi:ABC transporter [Patellaria atrata CBS 101060]|uniref:ABC transporter n=1 Tax=Patellaria atrata CBS 101060 TaxID=1346257 RepID=A0A9P4SEQ8_9PEZI|nr:ABC transporter [Patellaria atrata CBS 101060]